MTTEAPSTTADLPAGVTDTFTSTCECGDTLHVVAGVQQPHECDLTDEDRQAIRDAAAAEFDDEPAQTQQVDPIDLAQRLVVNVNNFLATRENPPIDKQLALAQAIATVELARWTKAQYALNLQLVQQAQAAQQRAQQVAKGPTGIVVPHIVPGRG